MSRKHLAEKVIIVNSISDLPAASGGKHQLADDTAYILGNPLNIGINHIALGNNTRLDSVGKDVTALTYTGTGAAIRGTNISGIVREIKVVGAAKGFEFIGTKTTEGINMFQCNFTSCTEIGSFDQMYFIKYANNTLVANTDGIEITDSFYLLIQGNNFFGNNQGTYISIPSGDFTSIKIVDNNMEINSTHTGINIDDQTITHTQEVVFAINQFEGTSPNRLVGHNPLDGDFQSIGNVGIPNLDVKEILTSTEMFNISNPRKSQIIYNSTLDALVYWDGGAWLQLDGTAVYQESYSEDFESGLGGWTAVDGGENDWRRGTAESNGGTYSLYVSNDNGVTAAYISQGGSLDVSHVYKDILLPNATSEIILQFDYKCEGELNFDLSQVFDVPTSTTPVANVELVSGRVGELQYNNQSNWITEQIQLPISEANTTRRIIFSWRNDTSVENNPPMCIDNIKILYI